MRYKIKPRDGTYVKSYRFLSFNRIMGKNISKKKVKM